MSESQPWGIQPTMKVSKLLLATAIVATTGTAAFAADIRPAPVPAPPPVVVPPPQPTGGPYVSVFGGLIWIPPVEVSAVFTPSEFLVSAERGYRFGGALGYNLSDLFGAEIEVTYARSPLGNVLNIDDPEDVLLELDADNFHSLLTVMGNLTVGFDLGRVRPYVALGAGAARLNLVVPGIGLGLIDTDWTWGVQALAGVDFELTRNISVGLRYRLQHIGPTNFIDEGDDPVALAPFRNHGVEAVLTVRF